MTMTEKKTADSEHIDVAVIAHPFAVERVRHRIAAGPSVLEIISGFQPDAVLRRHAHAYLNGDYVPQEKWARVYPKAGTIMSLRMVPMGGGGGGKNPLRTILSLAIMAASPVVAGALTGAMGATGSFLGISAGRLVTTGVNLLGRLALNAIAPPPKPRFSAGARESQTYFIQGARNQALPFGRVPKVLGRHRFVPPMGALPYTETAGNDQYLRMLFVWGYGPLEISDLRIGETPISAFEGVEIETRQGYASDAPLTLYSNAVLQNDLQVSVRQSDGYVLRTSEADADELSVDITLPRGLFRFNASNNKVASSVAVEVQYSLAGMNDWSAGASSFKSIAAAQAAGIERPAAYQSGGQSYSVIRIDRIVMDPASGLCKVVRGSNFRIGIDSGSAQAPAAPAGFLTIARVERRSGDAAVIAPNRVTDERNSGYFGSIFEDLGDFLAAPAAAADTIDIAGGGLKFKGIEITAKQSSAIRKCVTFKVARGQYDVRVKRLTADAASDNVFDETVWTALRTIRSASPVTMTGVAMTALRIKATDQMSGVIERFNGVVQSILPDWNGAGWVEQATSNPAALFRHVLQGTGNARPLEDARLDLARLEEWHATCAAAGREFNAVIDYDVSVREVLQDIAATGRASPAVIDGKWAVIEDRGQDVPIQHFTPRNSFNFQGRKSFDEMPHALRVRFINRDKGYAQDERLVYDDGYDAATAETYETLELNGVTSGEQAWKHGRYHIATARLRPEVYSFYADLEHIVCTRGDLIRFTHDVPLFGLLSARVAGLATNGDDITGATLDAEVTMEDGKSYSIRFRTSDGGTLVKNLQTVAGVSKDILFAQNFPPSEGLDIGDLALFGESGQESVELVVRAIEPQGDLSAKITCVDAAPAIHAADSGSIPAFSSHITVPPEMQRPPAPVLSQIQSGEEALIRHTDGSFTTRILITLDVPSYRYNLRALALIRASGETDFRAADMLSQAGNSVSITGVDEGETYDIQLRYVTESGVYSAPLLLSGHRVEGTSALPSDLENFSLRVLGDTAHLSWDAAGDIDLSHYTLRYSPLTAGVDWANAVDIVARISPGATSITLPCAIGTYLIKAVDVGGRCSANAASCTSTIEALSGHNAVLTQDESPGFTGSKTGLGISEGALQLCGADSFDDWSDVDAQVNVDLGDAGLETEGVYEFTAVADLGEVYTSRLTAYLEIDGIDLNNSIDGWERADDVENWDENVDPSLWSVSLQLRATQDDPDGSPAWSDWTPFVVGDYTARAFQFRLVLQSMAANVTPSVGALSVTVDMPDRTASARDIASLAAGSSVVFDGAFRATPAIAITAYNMESGDYYAITDASESGFAIRFFNSAGSGISRSFDYMAKGYGTVH